MNEFNTLKDISAKFEDVSIYIHQLRLEMWVDATKELSAYTNVWHAMQVHRKTNGCELVGDLHLLFRNQGEDFSSCLMLFSVVRASSDIDKNPRSVFCKLVQYMFDWMKEYHKENNIMDRTNYLFVLPDFGYSADDFKNLPTE